MNGRQRRTIAEIFVDPVRAGIRWAEIESALSALGCEITQGSGSRVRLKLNGERAVFHRPHPEPTVDKGAVRSMRRFLTNAGIKPDKTA